ncbi:mCG144492, partial [Mus musculus]
LPPAAVLGLCVTITLKLKHRTRPAGEKASSMALILILRAHDAEVTSVRIFHDRSRKSNESQVSPDFLSLTILRGPLGMLRKGSSLRLWRKDLQVKTPLPWTQDFTNASLNKTLVS